MGTKFDITCILWHFPLCSIVLAQIAQIYIHICKFGTWTSNLFFYFIVTIRDDDVESLCYWCFLLIIFMSVSALPALEKLVIFVLICMQWLQSLLCPKVITIAFLCTVYAGMLPSFVKQHFWTVKFLDLRACESLFMQVQYTGKILFHDLTGGMVEFPPLWNYYMYWEGFVDSLLISCNVYHVKLYVCFFCKDPHDTWKNCHTD